MNDSKKQRLLLIDDDEKLCRLVRDYLAPHGYEVTAVHNGIDGASRAIMDSWHAVILDVMLPEMDGFEVLKRIRAKSRVPVLMLTAMGDEADRIVGLELGADDYLPKTFSTRELLARLRAVTRRADHGDDAVDVQSEVRLFRAGDVMVNASSRTAEVGGTPLELTPVEFDLLLSLVRAKGRVRTRERLLEEIRDRHYDVFDRSIDVHVSALRKKLKDDPKNPRYIRTVRAAGYMFINPVGEA
jgi:DNA-binding response OmpR family regulator